MTRSYACARKVGAADMEILLQRDPTTATCTTGDLLIDGQFFCYTLEDTVREIPGRPVVEWKIPKQTAIPAGRYRLTYDYSPHFGKDMLHVNNVPGFLGIRIHSGMGPADTEGCPLVGDQKTKSSISGGIRHQVLDKLVAKVLPALQRGDACWITVRNAA